MGARVSQEFCGEALGGDFVFCVFLEVVFYILSLHLYNRHEGQNNFILS